MRESLLSLEERALFLFLSLHIKRPSKINIATRPATTPPMITGRLTEDFDDGEDPGEVTDDGTTPDGGEGNPIAIPAKRT